MELAVRSNVRVPEERIDSLAKITAFLYTVDPLISEPLGPGVVMIMKRSDV